MSRQQFGSEHQGYFTSPPPPRQEQRAQRVYNSIRLHSQLPSNALPPTFHPPCPPFGVDHMVPEPQYTSRRRAAGCFAPPPPAPEPSGALTAWDRPASAPEYPTDVIATVKQIFVDRGAFSGRSMARVIRNFDDGDGKITMAEFAAGMERYLGFPLREIDVRLVFEKFDKDGDGTIDVEEFLNALRGNLTSQRLEAIDEAFSRMDSDSSGQISLAELQASVNVSQHPKVLDGSMTQRDALTHFLSAWDTDGDGTVTKAEFLNFFKDVSIGTPDDQHFIHLMSNLLPTLFTQQPFWHQLPTPYGSDADMARSQAPGFHQKPRSNFSFSSGTKNLPLHVPVGRSVPWGQGGQDRGYLSGVTTTKHGTAGQCIQHPEENFERRSADPVKERGHPYRSMMPVSAWMDGTDSSLLRERETGQARQLDHRCSAHASPTSDSQSLRAHLEPALHPSVAHPLHGRPAKKAPSEAVAPSSVPAPCPVTMGQQTHMPHAAPAQSYMSQADSSLCRRRNWDARQADSVQSLLAWP